MSHANCGPNFNLNYSIDISNKNIVHGLLLSVELRTRLKCGGMVEDGDVNLLVGFTVPQMFPSIESVEIYPVFKW